MVHSTTFLQVLLFKQVCINPVDFTYCVFAFLTERYLGWHPSFARVKCGTTTVCGSFNKQSTEVLKSLSTEYSKPKIQLTEKMQDPYEPVTCNNRGQETLARACPILLQEDLFHSWQHWTIILASDIAPNVWYNDESTTLKQIFILPVLVFQYLVPLSSYSLPN